MDIDSDSDQEGTELTPNMELDAMITGEEAAKNYKEAGRLVPEEEDPISIEDYPEIMKSSQVTPVLQKILQHLALPYDLSDFQKQCHNKNPKIINNSFHLLSSHLVEGCLRIDYIIYFLL